MKRFLLILLFLLIPFLIPAFVSAQTSTNTSTASATSSASTIAKPNIFQQFFAWLFGLFTKTDYIIGKATNSDMTDYGDINDPNFNQKHSFAGSRLTDSNSQTCLKGNVIRKVILELDPSSYPNANLAQICPDSVECLVSNLNSGCKTITVKDLANYFVQINQKFYCIENSNELTDIGQDIKDKVSQFSPIPENEISCYQQIYDDFYITPKDTSNQNEENAKNIVQTPLSAENQDSTLTNQQIKDRVDQNFTPEDTNNPAGLSGLRPANW
jgi:hypothetical protein